MANGGGDDNQATWGAEALRINVVLHRLFPIPWANYCFAKEEVQADSDLQQRYIVYGSDADRRLVAYQRATNELEVALRILLEGQSSERWELWGRLNSPIEDARHIPASALGALTIDFAASTADAQGVPLFDLRLRRRTSPAIQEDSQETAKPAAVDPFYSGAAGRPSGAHLVREEAKRRIDAGLVTVSKGKLTQFAAEMSGWYAAERHRYKPTGPPLTKKTIVNTLRAYWNSKLKQSS